MDPVGNRKAHVIIAGVAPASTGGIASIQELGVLRAQWVAPRVAEDPPPPPVEELMRIKTPNGSGVSLVRKFVEGLETRSTGKVTACFSRHYSFYQSIIY